MTVGLLLGQLTSVAAAPSGKSGWSTSFDPRKRVFLSYVARPGGPRNLVIGCLRDVDLFSVISEGVVDAESVGANATLVLMNGQARYAAEGEIAPDPDIGTPTFSMEIDADSKELRRIRDVLLPVLERKGPIVLTVGTSSRELPVAGLAEALKRFKEVCFGSR
jgi:hypothetical protein